MKEIPKKIGLAAIRFYQRAISPLLGAHCRFVPTCSQYTYEAIQIHGLIKGIFLGAKRILKCNPFHPVMYDPVPGKNMKDSNKKLGGNDGNNL